MKRRDNETSHKKEYKSGKKWRRQEEDKLKYLRAETQNKMYLMVSILLPVSTSIYLYNI